MTLIEKIVIGPIGHECARPAAPSVPFACAVLCLDCDHITASKNNHCEHCGANGEALMPLFGARLPLSAYSTRPK